MRKETQSDEERRYYAASKLAKINKSRKVKTRDWNPNLNTNYPNCETIILTSLIHLMWHVDNVGLTRKGPKNKIQP